MLCFTSANSAQTAHIYSGSFFMQLLACFLIKKYLCPNSRQISKPALENSCSQSYGSNINTQLTYDYRVFQSHEGNYRQFLVVDTIKYLCSAAPSITWCEFPIPKQLRPKQKKSGKYRLDNKKLQYEYAITHIVTRAQKPKVSSADFNSGSKQQ